MLSGPRISLIIKKKNKKNLNFLEFELGETQVGVYLGLLHNLHNRFFPSVWENDFTKLSSRPSHTICAIICPGPLIPPVVRFQNQRKV
jgi:hypothetical protein